MIGSHYDLPVDTRPTTLQELAQRLSERSVVLPLVYQVDQNLDLVAPRGTTTETHRPGQILFGPLTWSVLKSLWTVGYPARREELGEVQVVVGRVMGVPMTHRPGGDATINIRRALVQDRDDDGAGLRDRPADDDPDRGPSHRHWPRQRSTRPVPGPVGGPLMPRRMTRVAIRATFMIIVAAALLGSSAAVDRNGSLPGAATVARAVDPSGGFAAFIDSQRSTYFWTGIDSSNTALYAHFVFYVQGVGSFMPGGAATVEPKSDHSAIVHYTGPGFVDHAAVMNLALARSTASGTPTATDVRLEAQVNPDHHTASAQLWSGPNTYKLVSVRPSADPAGTAQTIATLMKAQNWAANYDQLDSSYRALVTRNQWVQEESSALSAWLAGATLTNVTVGSTSPATEDPGYWTARFTLILTAQGGSGTKTHQLNGVLILEGSTWRFFTGEEASH